MRPIANYSESARKSADRMPTMTENMDDYRIVSKMMHAFVEWIRKPAVMFALAAFVLALNGLVFFHAEWPPLTWKNTHFAAGDFGQILLLYAGGFAIIALGYVALGRFTNFKMKIISLSLHFGLSLASVVALIFLDYWFSVTYKPLPNGDFWSKVLAAMSASFNGLIWATGIFMAGQLIFFFNLVYHFVTRPRVYQRA